MTSRRNLGLSGKRKLAYQFAMGFGFAALLLVMRAYGDFSTVMNIPFFKQYPAVAALRIVAPQSLDLRSGLAPFCIFVALVLVFISNAVNLTDGLDGLAIGLMVVSSGALTVLTYVGGHASSPNICNCRTTRALPS